MHVLVTGGAGFIGSHIVDFHMSRGDKVRVVDDLSTGSLDNIEPWRESPRLRFNQADLLTWPDVGPAAEWADRVYHFAAVVGMFRVLAEPIKVLAVNIAATERLMRAVAQANWRPQVVLASSSEVYGNNNSPQLREDMDIRIETGGGPRWNYAISKAANEALGLSYSRQHGIPVVSARLFNTTGPRQSGRYGMVVPRFVRQAVNGEPITVFGDGRQVRCFCDVRDTVMYLDQLAATESTDDADMIVNVGNQKPISILELAELVKERANSRSEIVFVPYEKAYGQPFEDIEHRRPSLERLYGYCEHRPQHDLQSTIDELIASHG